MHFTQWPWDIAAFPHPSRVSAAYLPLPLTALQLLAPFPSTHISLQMALLRRQVAYTYVVYDDQGPGLWGNYVGNWTHYTHPEFSNTTYTATPTPGATLSLTFSGTYVLSAWLGLQDTDVMTQIGSEISVYGVILNTTNNHLPSANYVLDGIPCELLDTIAPQSVAHLVSYSRPPIPFAPYYVYFWSYRLLPGT